MNRTIIFAMFLLAFTQAGAQSGTVLESLTLESKVVNYPVNYSIYLPPDYETSNREFPVLYLLHGYTDDETGWIQFGEANRIADQEIGKGESAPCIIVMPDGKVSLYCNHYNGNDNWEDMFIEEFIPFIESQYRIRKKREFRAIAGLSMGGNGALLLSMRHPEIFSSCVALSSAVFTDEAFRKKYGNDNYFKDIYGPVPEDGEVSEHWKKYAPLHILDRADKKALNSVRFYIDCGDDDFLYAGNAALHVKMRDMGIQHEFRVRDGKHEWEYWRTGLVEGLRFISQKFHR